MNAMIMRAQLISLLAAGIILATMPALYFGLAGKSAPQQPVPVPTPSTISAVLPTTRLSGPIPLTAGHARLRFHTQVLGKFINIPVIFSISGELAHTTGRIPVLLYLGGAGDRGMDGDGVFRNGPPAEMNRRANLNESMPMMIVAPQCPQSRDWDDPVVVQALMNLMAIVAADPRVDADRIYLNGYSLGGTGAWAVAAAGAKYFAAIAPISGRIYSPDSTAAAIKGVPTWIICGGNDGPFLEGSRAMAAAMEKIDANFTFTVLPGVGHTGWESIYPNREFYDWFLAHKRGQPATKNYSSQQLLAIALANPSDPAIDNLIKQFAQFAPYWHISNCSAADNPGVRAVALGRKNVLVIRPLNRQVGCLMETTWSIPAGKKATLNISRGWDGASAYRLTVNIDHKTMLSQAIDSTSHPEAWKNLSFDLPAARPEVELELIVTATTNVLPTAYFSKIEVTVQ